MKIVLALFLMIFTDDFKDISKINDLKKQAQEAYLNKDYAGAAASYKKLVEDYKVEDERVIINLANAYYELKDTTNASANYLKSITAKNKSIQSQAYSQLGVMAHNKQQLNESLAMFKEALKADPENEAARFNYELVKKIINNQKDNDQENSKENEEDKIKPSEFAKQLKDQADKLVMSRKYGEAFDLMMNGIKKDQTVSYYKDFISRLNDIIEIQ